MQSTIQLDEVDKIIDGIGCEEKNIISILQGVQEHYRYLPKEVFPHIAKPVSYTHLTLPTTERV